MMNREFTLQNQGFSVATQKSIKIYVATAVYLVCRNHFEKWDGKSGRFWTDYSDWLFNKFVLKNCNPVLRENIRKNIEANLLSRKMS